MCRPSQYALFGVSGTVDESVGEPAADPVTSWLLDIDYADRLGLVAETGSPSRIIAAEPAATGRVRSEPSG